MASGKDKLDVHVVVTVTGDTLSAIVDQSRRHPCRNEKTGLLMDSADMVGMMISRFLETYDFEGFVRDEGNYPR